MPDEPTDESSAAGSSAAGSSTAGSSAAEAEPAADGEAAGTRRRRGPRWAGRRAEAYALLELAAVAGVALAQPLLDVIGKSPDFFLFYGAGPIDVLAMVAVFVLAPPLALWGLGLLVGLAGPRARAGAHLAALGGLFTLLAVQVGKQAMPVRGLPLALLALAVGALLVVAYRRWQAARQLVRVAAVGPVVFALLFVFGSPASAVVLGGDAATPDDATATSGTHPPIVMIVLDELPLLSLLDGHGKIDATRYPSFAALAAGATWYRNATAASGWTPRALPAMLTGRFPTEDVAPHYSQYPQNLFTLLGPRYDLAVQESITQLCPPRSCERDENRRGGLPTMLGESAALLRDIVSPNQARRDPTAGFVEPTVAEDGAGDASAGDASAGDGSETDAPTDPKFRWDSLDDNQPVRFREFVTGIANDRADAAGPTLHFLHLLLPHTPWRYLANGVRYEAPEDLPTGGDQWWPQLARQRHLAQLRYTDALLGETLTALRDSGRYDESMIVVTADHGVTFSRDSVGRGLGHVQASPAETLWVPMFLKAPGQRAGAVDDRNWMHVDLLPTIAAHAGFAVAGDLDGVSATGPPRAGASKEFHDSPTDKITVDGTVGLRVITGETGGFPALAAPPPQDLVGRTVADLAVVGGGPAATVANLAEFADADPTGGTVPALIYGSAPDEVPAGATLAVAVNGRIGAVAPVLPRKGDEPRFAALLPDPAAFRAGANQLELFLVEGDRSLRRLSI